MTAMFVLSGLALATWIYLILFHGGFWRLRERLPASPAPAHWPAVVAVVPARDEADVIARAIGSLLDQDYPGPFHVVLVDDNSSDGTGGIARRLAAERGLQDRLTVIDGDPLAPGWTGKVWAMEQGLGRALEIMPDAERVLFTDADIAHPPSSVRALVAFAVADRRDLVSLMVRLVAATPWERLLVPAFVLFFAKLYPFARVNDPRRSMAAAAGGCMLADRAVLDRGKAMAAISDRLIDDCALADLVRRHGSGRIWLGLGPDHLSLRGYDGLAGVWRMVARTAFTQLRHSPLLLAGTVLGMVLVYLAGPVTLLAGLLAGGPLMTATGLATCILMTLSFVPALRLYRQPLALAPLLPLAGILYTLMTVDSARRHWRRRGGGWKGRYQAKGTDRTGDQGA
ncbi:MAG: glycosyltransferase [Pseudomonadota bacterium]|nr:glycosyltransferase [Pseudomonadota bacterium]